MNSDPNWIAYLAALLTPIVAVLGSFIAYRQWRLAQNKLKLELFDRRFSVYDATRALIASITSSGKAEGDEVFKFMVATREAKWLLNDSIAEYLEKQIYHKVIDLQTLASELEGVGVGEVRTKNVHEQAAIKKWLVAQFGVLDEKFTPFLKLRH